MNKRKLLILGVMEAVLVVMGGVFLLLVVLSYTDVPWNLREKLDSYRLEKSDSVHTIVMMGAGGFPSDNTLMRIWYTSQIAGVYPDAQVVVANPGDTADLKSTSAMICSNLELYGVSRSRILIENEGVNTRHQALNVYDMCNRNLIDDGIVIVTSPEHSYRAVKSFRKAGFKSVVSFSAREKMLESNLQMSFDEIGKNNAVPDVGGSISVRYKMWDYLKCEIDVLREYAAIVYYKLNGWL